jgi:hypothetical protein
MTTAARGARAASPDQEQAASAAQVPQFLQPVPPRQDSADEVTIHPAESRQETRGNHPEDSYDDDGASEAEPSSLASTPRKGLQLKPLVTAEQIKGAQTLVGAILMGATTLFNRKLRHSQDDDKWLMSRQERDDIAAPLARIMARRSPIPGGGEEVSDLADGVEAVVKILAFALDQMIPTPAAAAAMPVVQPAEVVREQAAQSEPLPPAGPGATFSPLDPAYRPY